MARVNGQDELIVCVSKKVKGFDPKSGAERWSCSGLGALVYTSPVVSADGGGSWKKVESNEHPHGGSQIHQQGGVLFIVWDESGAAEGQVALLVVAPSLRGKLTMPLNHYSLLATIADRLRVPRLGLAKQATSLHPQLEAASRK